MLNKNVIALGADIKNRFLVVKDNHFYFGPDLGDLNLVENYQILKKKLFKATRGLKPHIITYDLHPGYFSSHLAKEYAKKLPGIHSLPVQHHHAHIASVIFEHNLKKTVIGISFDGTGYGMDGHIWGGEFFMADKCRFRRCAHFKYIMMPGGDKASYEPWRMILSILKEKGIPFLKSTKKKDIEVVLAMMLKRINSPFTSSAGRLFDAAAALLGICTTASYEAEGPLKLEKLCDSNIEKSYNFNIIKDNNCYIIDADLIFLEMSRDIIKGKNRCFIATKFHNTIVKIIVHMVNILSKSFDVANVVLSGGVFQNNFLKTKAIKKLETLGYRVYINEKLPAGDYNISLGQYYVSCLSCKN